MTCLPRCSALFSTTWLWTFRCHQPLKNCNITYLSLCLSEAGHHSLRHCARHSARRHELCYDVCKCVSLTYSHSAICFCCVLLHVSHDMIYSSRIACCRRRYRRRCPRGTRCAEGQRAASYRAAILAAHVRTHVAAKPLFVLYSCRYVLHRHDEAALLSLVWQGAFICRTVRQMRWTACVSMIFALLKPFFFFIFALVYSLHRRCPVVARRWFVAASAGFSLRCRSHGRRSR
jgi:hypothetical protein